MTTKRVYKKRKYTRNYNPGYREYKFIDTVLTDAVVASTGGITTSPNLIMQGIAENNRIGRKVTIKSIACRWELSLPAVSDGADITSGDICRIIIFHDKQANGANAAVLDILELAEWDSFLNLANKNRFVILMDRFTVINRLVAVTDGTNTSTTPLVLKFIKFYKKLNINVEFSGVSGAITELTSSNISFLYISSEGICGLAEQQTRIRFVG